MRAARGICNAHEATKSRPQAIRAAEPGLDSAVPIPMRISCSTPICPSFSRSRTCLRIIDSSARRFREPALQFPAEWESPPADRPLVYVTLGSSGATALLPAIVATLGSMHVTGMVATAGVKLQRPPANVLVAEMLPGIEAARRSNFGKSVTVGA